MWWDRWSLGTPPPLLWGLVGHLPLLLTQFPRGKEFPQTEKMGNESWLVQEEWPGWL